MKQGSIIRTVDENNPAEKRPLGRPRLGWEDCITKDVGGIEADLQWREAAEDRDIWRASIKGRHFSKKKKNIYFI